MVAAMNGMAVHGGLIPYGGTFLVFTDYCRPAIRLAALMRQRGDPGRRRTIRSASARTARRISRSSIWRPCAPSRTCWCCARPTRSRRAECWQAALRARARAVGAGADAAEPAGPARPSTPTENLCARGAYVLAEADGGARRHHPGDRLRGRHRAWPRARRWPATGIDAAVVSMPSWELFERQDPHYRAAVLGAAPRVAVEAASPFGWTRYVASERRRRRHDAASAPARPIPALYAAFRHHRRGRGRQGARACRARTDIEDRHR